MLLFSYTVSSQALNALPSFIPFGINLRYLRLLSVITSFISETFRAVVYPASCFISVMPLSENHFCRFVLNAQVLKKRLRRSIMPLPLYPNLSNSLTSRSASPSHITFSISVSSSFAESPSLSSFLTHTALVLNLLTLSGIIRIAFFGNVSSPAMLLRVRDIYACHEAWSDTFSSLRPQELHAIISSYSCSAMKRHLPFRLAPALRLYLT